MKTFSAPLIVLAVLIALGILNCAQVSSRIMTVSEEIGACAAAAEQGDWHAAETLAQGAHALWVEKQFYLCAIARRTNLDYVEESLMKIIVYAREQERSELISEAAAALHALDGIKKQETLYLPNIL